MVRPPPGPSRVHTVPARHTARRIAPSQARATSTLPAAHDTHNHAALRRPCERLAALLHSCSSGASTKSSDSFELLQAPAPSHGKVCDVGTWEGGWDGLASAVLVRLPSVQSARLQRSSSGAPLAHPALDSPACASRSCPFSDLQPQREQLSRIGLHGWMANRTLHPTMEPDLRGRTARDLQSRNKAGSETYRDKSSDLAQLGLDHALHLAQININLFRYDYERIIIIIKH